MLYDHLKEIAQEKGISIYRIERESGLSNGTISKWNSATPSVGSLQKVAQYLEISIDDLLKNIEPKK